MFQYTTETIINSNKGNLAIKDQPEKVRFALLKADGNGAPKPEEKLEEDDFFIVDGAGTFKVGNIKKIYHSPHRPASPATVTLTAPTVEAGDIVRLTVVLSETGNVRSTIQNAYLRNTKPFHVEVEVKDPDAVLEELSAVIKKQLAMSDFKYFTMSENGTKLTAADCYIQFDKVSIDKVLESGDFGGYGANHTDNLFLAKAGDACVTPGDQGAGTVARIVKDLRIPTNASINPFAADQGGRPIPGGEYEQYLIEYETERRHVSGAVMGSIDRSITSHVFFVEQKAFEAWKAIIEKIGTVIEAGYQNRAEISDKKFLKKTEMGSVE